MAAPRIAEACSYGANEHKLDEAEKAVDKTPPGTPTIGPITISRGHGPMRAGCGSTASSCDDIGSVSFTLAASDDRTPAAMMGFRITATGRNPPSTLFPVAMDVRTFDGTLWVKWLDGNTDDQESLAFDLEVRAIDLAGNVSAEVAIVKVRQDTGGGSMGGGSTRTGDGAGVIAFGVLAAFMVTWRKHGHRALALALAVGLWGCASPVHLEDLKHPIIVWTQYRPSENKSVCTKSVAIDADRGVWVATFCGFKAGDYQKTRTMTPAAFEDLVAKYDALPDDWVELDSCGGNVLHLFGGGSRGLGTTSACGGPAFDDVAGLPEAFRPCGEAFKATK